MQGMSTDDGIAIVIGVVILACGVALTSETGKIIAAVVTMFAIAVVCAWMLGMVAMAIYAFFAGMP